MSEIATNPELLEHLKQEQLKMFNQIYKIECQVLEDGILPSKKNAKDAGFDLYATDDVIIYPGQVVKHPLNIRLKLPNDTWAEITTKSGLGAKGQLVYAGVIDEEYRGIPHVVMTNVKMFDNGFPSEEDYEVPGKVNQHGMIRNLDPLIIKKGEKIAQMIMNSHSQYYFIEQVEEVDTNTARAEGGFGSTGK